MAFAVTAWKAYANRIDQGTIKRFETVLEMHITGANTDVDMDIGDTTTPGQFFTDAEADATYGATATALKNYLNSIKAKISTNGLLFSEVLEQSYTKVAGTPSLANEYGITQWTSSVPDILFVSGSAPTAIKLTMKWQLKTGEWPLIDTKYGTGI
jgi:hypothetical protein